MRRRCVLDIQIRIRHIMHLTFLLPLRWDWSYNPRWSWTLLQTLVPGTLLLIKQTRGPCTAAPPAGSAGNCRPGFLFMLQHFKDDFFGGLPWNSLALKGHFYQWVVSIDRKAFNFMSILNISSSWIIMISFLENNPDDILRKIASFLHIMILISRDTALCWVWQRPF